MAYGAPLWGPAVPAAPAFSPGVPQDPRPARGGPLAQAASACGVFRCWACGLAAPIRFAPFSLVVSSQLLVVSCGTW